jgi:DegV family protein with EDD domain
MGKIAILTDSTASLPEAFIEKLNIYWVAYYIHRGQEVLRDLVTIKRDEFLNWLTTAKVMPTTASPGPGDYIDAYEKMALEGITDIVSIHMTSKGSGAYQAAKVAQSIAQEQLPGIRVEVIDTQNVSLCTGWMVLEAAREAQAGKAFDEVITTVKEMIPVTRMIQTADTLKYLYMGGRIGKAQHLMGSLLNIKPLIGMNKGTIVPLGQARSRAKAYQAMVDLIDENVGASKIKIAYVHAGAQKEVEKIKEMVESRLTVVESFFAELSPALAVHTGPGTAGVCYYPVKE